MLLLAAGLRREGRAYVRGTLKCLLHDFLKCEWWLLRLSLPFGEIGLKYLGVKTHSVHHLFLRVWHKERIRNVRWKCRKWEIVNIKDGIRHFHRVQPHVYRDSGG